MPLSPGSQRSTSTSIRSSPTTSRTAQRPWPRLATCWGTALTARPRSVAFVADVAHDLATRLLGRETDWGVDRGALDGIHDFMAAGRAPELLASLVDGAPSHLDEDMQLASNTCRRFTDEQIAPRAEHVHRTNADVPEELIEGLAELGIFGLSAPDAAKSMAGNWKLKQERISKPKLNSEFKNTTWKQT